MGKSKIAISLDEEVLDRLDQLVDENVFRKVLHPDITAMCLSTKRKPHPTAATNKIGIMSSMRCHLPFCRLKNQLFFQEVRA